MTAKEYLQQLQRLDIVISQKNSEKEELKRRARSISAIDYSKEKVKTAPSGEAAFERITDRIYELEKEIMSEIDQLVDKTHVIVGQICSLQNTDHVDLLLKRYVEFKSLKKICTEMNFSYEYIRHLHIAALREFEKKFFVIFQT